MGRTTRISMAILVALALAAPAWAQPGQRPGAEQRREQWQKVPEIFEAMLLKPGAVVADVGAGDGFFTSRLSAAVGETGKVIAVDIGDRALQRLRQRVTEEGLKNVEIVEGAPGDPRLPVGGVDAVLIVNAYHEMTEYPAMLVNMKAALKPGGRLVIVEPIAASRRQSPRPEQTRNHEIGIEFVKQDAREAGFRQVMAQDPFTSRQHGPGGRVEEEWLLVLTPQTQAAAAWAASKEDDWQAPGLRITPDEFKRLNASGEAVPLDVRDAQSYRAGHLPGAALIAVDELASPENLAKLKLERRLIVAYCS